jgi:hypothetical protein
MYNVYLISSLFGSNRVDTYSLPRPVLLETAHLVKKIFDSCKTKDHDIFRVMIEEVT